MAIYNDGYGNIKVTLLSWEGENLARRAYEFGRLSNDFNYKLQENYNENSEDCYKLISKIINGTTLPKYVLYGHRIEFRIENISRICLAQLTRDNAIFASQGGGVFPLSQNLNIPANLYSDESIMKKLKKAQKLLEKAYVEACEKEYPALEARYLGLHCQTISLTASYTLADFVRSCHSRTSSNFCDECNYVYRLMFRELFNSIIRLRDSLSIELWKWQVNEKNCINDNTYKRERLYNSDFTPDDNYKPELPAINDWRKSCWKIELERMYENGTGWLTDKEKSLIKSWKGLSREQLKTTYDSDSDDAAKNAIKKMHYYKESK